MVLLISQIIIGTIWGLTSLLTASMFAAMFAPEKERIILRCFYTALMLVPAIIIIPLSFAACALIIATGFFLLLTIIGPKAIAELVLNGIPEMDFDDENLDPITRASGVKRDV
tara:strand:- start:140 stop:478 length:339 start_codon:yes stop_codon:yes gene_type:complete